MTKKLSLKTTTALTLAASIFASGLLPVAQASAHDRHHAAKHGYNHSNWNKRNHRQFHHNYGRGNHGVHAYNQQKQYRSKKRKKSSRRDAIAAGAIGLAIGAIIASQASKNKQTSQQQYRQPQPTYQYDGHNQPRTRQHIPLDQYDQPVQSRRGNPDVVTFRGSASLEPWTPGWREWCDNRYRSFNHQTGTYRGFDGLDHFCVPK